MCTAHAWGELARRSPRHLPCGEVGEAGWGGFGLSFFSSVIYRIGYRLYMATLPRGASDGGVCLDEGIALHP